LPYRKPPGLIGLNPGYALHETPGSVTDDTFIRLDLARFYLNTNPPYTPGKLADYLLKHARFENWWGQAVKVLRRIEKGQVRAEQAGLTHIQGGGGGWWQPVAILNASNPKAASKEAGSLCRIWKAPLEQDILSSVVAGQAEAFKKNSTIDSIVETVINDSGPLATKLFERAVSIARKAKTPEELYEQLYKKALVKKCSKEVDGPMPEHVEPVDYAEGFYTSISFAEQQPWALAYFVFGKGDPERTVLTAVKGGRDADSIATNTASWLGAMSGESIWPKKWRDTVCNANLVEMDLRQICEDLLDVGIRNGSVRLSSTGDKVSGESRKPVKVFLLAGQSNMEGQGVVSMDHPRYYNSGRGNLVNTMKDPNKAHLYKHLKNEKGEWVVRDDVKITFRDRSGGLTIGYTGYGGSSHIGPELQFGHFVGDYYDEPVLLIKTAWGGKSLFKDFRPPSSGGTVGQFYKLMLEDIHKALDNMEEIFPDLVSRGYEIAGFVWMQGWNDMCDPKAIPEYDKNLVNLVKDLRKEFKSPNLPVVIGELGNGGPEAKGNMAAFRKAQKKGAEQIDNAAFVITHDFWREPEQSPNVSHGHHWCGNAESYFLIGDALGKGFIKLIEGKTLKTRD
ncbi:MAG: sialate O-acetylesterase, partial [Planctomycetota bacterium]